MTMITTTITVYIFFPLAQRNHTLFGSVWSSMRRQKPFSRNRMLKSGDGKNNNSHNAINNNTISSLAATSAAHSMSATTAIALSGEYLGSDYSNNPVFMQRDRLTEGLNNITKSILLQKGGTGQLEQHDDIPLRPLLLNGNNGHNQGSAANNVQNPANE